MDAGGRRGRCSTAASLEAGLGPGLSRPLDRQLAGPLGAVLGLCFLAWARLGLLGPESVDLALGQGTTLVVVTPSCPHVAPAHTLERVVAKGTAKPPDGGLTAPPRPLAPLLGRPPSLPPTWALCSARPAWKGVHTCPVAASALRALSSGASTLSWQPAHHPPPPPCLPRAYPPPHSGLLSSKAPSTSSFLRAPQQTNQQFSES